MNGNMSVIVICVEMILYFLLFNLHAFNLKKCLYLFNILSSLQKMILLLCSHTQIKTPVSF